MIFHELRLHKAFFDENLCIQIAVARRITACCSRGRNCAVGDENTCFFEKYAPKIEVSAPRRARYGPAFLKYENNGKFMKKSPRKLRFLPRGERDTARPSPNIKIS